MAWLKAEIVCRNHPNENPQPGVCPSCLRERLSRIAGINSRTKNNTFSSSPWPVYFYYSSSGHSSPANRRRGGHQRVTSDIMDSIYFTISGKGGLKKSRSMAFASRDVNRNKKGGFWNKLLLRSIGKKPA